MERLWLVMLGGAIGSGARYLVGLGVSSKLLGAFPYSTLIVNVCGSFAMGIIAHLALHNASFTPDWRAFAAAGVLGGFTTYSTFNQETIDLVHAGSFGLALLYTGLTAVACLTAGFAGMALARMFAAG